MPNMTSVVMTGRRIKMSVMLMPAASPVLPRAGLFHDIPPFGPGTLTLPSYAGRSSTTQSALCCFGRLPVARCAEASAIQEQGSDQHAIEKVTHRFGRVKSPHHKAVFEYHVATDF